MSDKLRMAKATLPSDLTEGELARLERSVIEKTRAARLLGGATEDLCLMQRALRELKTRRRDESTDEGQTIGSV